MQRFEGLGQDPPKLENGRVVIRDLVPGRYRISLADEVTGWRLESVMFGDRDALDFGVDVKAGDNLPGRAILTRSTTEISGRVTGPLAVEADPQGRFAFQNLPVGRYRLAVVEDFDRMTGVHPALIRRLAASPTVDASLAAGARVVVDVRVR
jgi:hypothetical protein